LQKFSKVSIFLFEVIYVTISHETVVIKTVIKKLSGNSRLKTNFEIAYTIYGTIVAVI